MKGTAQRILVLLIASAGVAQMNESNAAEIRKMRVAGRGSDVELTLSLTAPVTPAVTVATGPDRLVLELPNTVVNAKQRRISVNQNGVKQVRVGLNSASPPLTRVVVDLDAAHPYRLAAQGNTIILTVLPAANTATSGGRNRRSEAAASAPLIGWLLRRQPRVPASQPTAVVHGVAAQQPSENRRVGFKVKYVAEGAAYLYGGRSSGLAEGMKLVVRDSSSSSGAATQDMVVAELRVVSVAETSAVTEIHASKRDVKPGDWAYLSAEDSARLLAQRSSIVTGKNQPANALIEGKPEEKAHEGTSAPTWGGESRIRARIGLDYSGIRSSGSTLGSSSQVGLSFRTDMTRIGGTFWNLQGYWRGRLTSNSQPDEETMQDYLDRTYTIQLYYDNPNSKWVAGVGRLYLPWAISLDTIDGGYIGRRVASGITTGVFAGSTPDPTSWHYSPDRQIAGSFVNFEGGSYEAFHYTSTTGVALSTLKWQLDRPYVFLENAVSLKKYISVYHSFIVDDPQGVSTGGIKPGVGISRSYLTVHIEPSRRVSFDIYHNYFRDVPTAATQLIGSGLVDKLLYQGVNAGVRIEPVRHIYLYTTIGQSDKTGDARRSLNQMYGLTFNEIWRTGIRADLRYSKFDSSFARGEYRVVSLSRHLNDRILWDAQVGSQSLRSAFTANNRSMFVATSFDTNIGRHTFLQSGYTVSRGAQLNYSQGYISLGYRFDVRGPAK